VRGDRRAELALEPLEDDRGVGLAHRAEDLLAGRRPFELDGRVLLEQPGEGGTHLVEVLLGEWLDRDHEGGRRELERRQSQRPLLRPERIPRLGDRELRHRPDLAGLQFADRLLLLAVQEEQLTDPLILVAGRVPDVGLGAERPRQDAQVRQPPDEWIGGRLEHAHEERAGLVGGHVDRRAALVERRDRRLVSGGGKVPDDRVEESAQTDALRRRSDEDRREHAVLDALAQARLELGIGDLLAVEVLDEDVVVGLRGRREELLTASGDLVGQILGDRDLDLRGAVPAVRLAMDEVDVALERLGGADRDLERRDLLAERRAQRVEGSPRVGVLPVALVDEEARGAPRRAAQADRLLEAGLDARRGVHDEQRPVDRGEALDHVRDEVGIAGGVDERDPGPVVLERADREAQRLPALLLLGVVVEVGRAVVDAPEPRDRPGAEEQLLGERRLAGAGVAGQDDASQVGQVDALHRHRATILQWTVFDRVGGVIEGVRP
jgi:hypothetical protein